MGRPLKYEELNTSGYWLIIGKILNHTQEKKILEENNTK